MMSCKGRTYTSVCKRSVFYNIFVATSAEIQYKYNFCTFYNIVNTMFIHFMYSSLSRRAALFSFKQDLGFSLYRLH